SSSSLGASLCLRRLSKMSRSERSISRMASQSSRCSTRSSCTLRLCRRCSSLAGGTHALPAFTQRAEQVDYFVQTFQRQRHANIGQTVDAVVIQPRQTGNQLAAVFIVQRAG